MGKRRKNVTQTAFYQNIQPPADNQQIVRALGSRGGNIVEVEYPNGATTLCMMPAKFNCKLWVRRGGFVIIEPSPEAEQDAGSRVTGTISAVLYDEHIKQLKKMPGVWPAEFAASSSAPSFAAASDLPPSSSSEEGEEGEEDIPEAGSSQQGNSAANGDGSWCGAAARPAASAGAGSAAAEAAAAAGCGSQHAEADELSSEEDDGLPPLQQIHNRRVVHYEASDSSEDESGEG